MNEDIFKNAHFGKSYKTRGNKTAIYHYSEEHKSGDGKVWTYHYLMIEPFDFTLFGKTFQAHDYVAYINDNGIGRLANLKYYKNSGASAEYDIISEA